MSDMPFEDLVQRLRDLATHRATRQEAPFVIPKEKFTEWIAADKLEELRHHIRMAPAALNMSEKHAAGFAEKDGRLLP